MIFLIGCGPIVLDLEPDSALPDTSLPDAAWQVQGDDAGAFVGVELDALGDEVVISAEDAVAVHSLDDQVHAFSEGRLHIDAQGLTSVAVVGDQLALGFGGSDTVWLLDQDLEGLHTADAGTALAPEGAEAFGTSVAPLDMDGDGLDELAVGAPDDAWTFGRATVYDDDLADTLVRVTGSWTGDALGELVAGADVDGDGYDDLVACSARFADYGADASGLCGVVAGGAEPSSEGTIAREGLTLRGEAEDDGLGSSLAVGDLDDDGVDEVLIGTAVGVVHLVAGGSWVDELALSETETLAGDKALAVGPGGVVLRTEPDVSVVVDGATVDAWSGETGEVLGDSAIWLGDALLVGSASWSHYGQMRGRVLTAD